jgi:hypothetical protein
MSAQIINNYRIQFLIPNMYLNWPRRSFNASRVLIDSPRAAYKSIDFLENNIKPVNLDGKQQVLFNEVKIFVLEIIPRPAVGKALSLILASSDAYQILDVTVKDL